MRHFARKLVVIVSVVVFYVYATVPMLLAKEAVSGGAIVLDAQDPMAWTFKQQKQAAATVQPLLSDPPEDANTLPGERRYSLLAWQLARQSVFVAATQELKLSVRDVLCGEVPLEEDDALRLEIVGKPGGSKRNSEISAIVKVLGTDEQWATALPSLAVPTNYRTLLEHLEPHTRGELRDFLRDRIGADTKPPLPGKLSKEDSAEINKLLDDLTVFSHFLALRKIHAALARTPETPKQLGQAVRAYANLGLLTEHYMHPMHAAFKARSLLYAQRMVALFPDSPLGPSYRAYAYAMCGLHGEALQDIEAVKKTARDNGGKVAAPPVWIEWIEAFCRCERTKLEALAKKRDNIPLLGWLWYMTTEHENSYDLTTEVGIATAQTLPHPFRIYDHLCTIGGVGLLHRATVVPHQDLVHAIYYELPALQELPESVRKEFDQTFAGNKEKLEDVREEYSMRRKIINSLKSAKLEVSSPEPTWAILGACIEEESFKQIGHRVRFLSVMYSSNPNGLLFISEPLIGEHRFMPILHTYAWDGEIVGAAVELMKSDEFAMARSLYQMRFLPRDKTWQGEPLEGFNRYHADDTANDLNRWFDDPDKVENLGDRLAAASPHSPQAITTKIDTTLAPTPEQLQRWDEVSQERPRLLRALGIKYKQLDRLDEAERCFKSSVAIEPSYSGYSCLTDLYALRKQDDLWLQAWDDYLKTPSLGLEDARVRVMISKKFRGQGDWQTAERYAEAAAESYADWAISEAIIVYEAQQNWSKALKWHEAKFDRYGNNALHWYLFCRRTGQGDVTVTQPIFAAQAEQFAQSNNANEQLLATQFYLLEGDLPQAITVAEKIFQRSPYGLYGLMLAMLQDETGKHDERDATLAKTREAWRLVNPNIRRGTRLLALVDAIVADLEAAKQGQEAGFVDLGEEGLKKLSDGTNFGEVVSFNYFAGCYCMQRGNKELAIKLWKRGMAFETLDDTFRSLTGAALIKQNIRPEDYREIFKSLQPN